MQNLNKAPRLSRVVTLIYIFCVPIYISAAEVIEITAPTLEAQGEQMLNIVSGNIAPQIGKQTDSLRAMNNTLQQSLMGTTSVGSTNNLPVEQAFRDWTPSSADLINMVEQGLQTGSLADQIAYYNQKFHIPSAEQLVPGNPNTPLADYGVFSAVNTNAALGIADRSFDNVAHILQQINFLYRQIDQQRTVKQSQELNSVILLKIAALQTDLIRLQSQQLKMQAISNAKGNSERAYMTQFVQDIK